MIWLIVLFSVVVALPLLIEANRKPMNSKARQGAPGQFATLSQGVTHYQWAGKPGDPVVVCIHGLTTPSFVWQGLSKGLVALGFHVLTYDLFGRGFSDRPSGKQTQEFFLRQLNDLLENQKVEEKVVVIGYSMGATIATAFAARLPQRLHRAVLLAPAGMAPVGSDAIRRLVQIPILGKWLILTRYPQILRKGIDAEANLASSVPDIAKLQKAELNYRGFLPAIRASLSGLLNKPLSAEHIAIHQAAVPVLAIWGADDDLIPMSCKDKLTHWNKDAENEVIAGAGHGLTYTHSPQVLALIQEFLSPDA